MTSKPPAPVIVWFRQDLRLSHNPALAQAARDGAVIPVFILDETAMGDWTYGGASRWWLHHALESLGNDLKALGLDLVLKRGSAEKILMQLIKENNVRAVYWNRRYEPNGIAQDTAIKAQLKKDGVNADSFNGHVLCEPWTVENKSGNCYKVYTPFSKACFEKLRINLPKIISLPKKIETIRHAKGDKLTSWKLLPTAPDWSGGMKKAWIPTEETAQEHLHELIKDKIGDYSTGRDFPATDSTSRLSPYIAFGLVSPQQIWVAVHHALDAGHIKPHHHAQAEHFLREILWRDFNYHLLYHFPHLPEKPLQEKFKNFPWLKNKKHLIAWQKGMTGYPIVDAGMRQLWQTGWMHNRVRMIVGSFLVKNLLLSWRNGEKWFWDTLVDADLANNAGNWQWIGGCGADAAPYFRVFNPVTQSGKFDANGDYIRAFVPELKNLPDKYLHNPGAAPITILKEAGITLGKTYPHPLVELPASRLRALQAFKSMN